VADYTDHHARAGKLGGMTRALRKTNEEGRKEAARRGRMARFEAQVPDSVTDPVERARLVDLAMRLHMTRMAQASAQKRAKPARVAKKRAA
jgi:hypothetical protein